MVSPPSSRDHAAPGGGESPSLRPPHSPHLEGGSRMPSWAGQSYHDGSSDRGTSPLASPRLDSPHLEEPGAASLRSPPLSSVRNSRYSAVPVSEDERDFPRSGRSTPAWLNTDRSGAFSSAASYGNFNELPPGKSRSHSFSSTAMLGRDYDSVAGLNAVAMDKYEGGSWDRSRETSDTHHPRAAHLAKYGVGAGASRKKKCILISILAVVVLIVVVAVAVPVAIVTGGSDGKAKGTTQTDGHGHGKNGALLTTGGNGTVIDLANGSSFTYINQYGGFWVSDLLNDSAQAQSYTKPLSQDWDWANDRIFGVNLGGWLVTEPFIAPSLYQPYANTSTPAVDEFTLSQQWLKEGGQANLEKKMRAHYDTFITEQDFADIAGAGLNWVRLPIAFWAFETVEGEPYLAKVSWEYVLKAIQWARKYGIRINLDFHAAPGGQNTYNHSGKLNSFGWLNGVMGVVNAQRTLNYIRAMIEFTSQPEIRKVVPLVSILNEPNVPRGIGLDQLKSFYVEAYTMIRNITGNGVDHGPFIGLHDGFMGVSSYNNFLMNSDRVAFDTHPYICFTPPYGDSYDNGISNVCSNFAHNTDQALSSHGAYLAGEWSLALNDCGLYLNNVNQGTRYEGTYPGSTQRYGSCQDWDDWQNFNATRKADLKRFALAQMSSLRNFFFWTWHIGDSLDTNATVNPMWNYKLGLQQGWMPTNINDVAAQACQSEASSLTISSSSTSWSGSFQAWQTGAASSYSISTGSWQWPPATLQTTNGQATASMTDPVSNLPSYTATGAILIMPSPTYSASVDHQSVPSLGAWANPSDTVPGYAAIANCPYPTDPYYNGTLPSGFPCGGGGGGGGGGGQRRAEPTAAPVLRRAAL